MILVLPLAAIGKAWEVGAGVLVLMVLAAWAIHQLSRPSPLRRLPAAEPERAPDPDDSMVPAAGLKSRKANGWLTGVALILVFVVYSTVFYVLPTWVFVAVWIFGALVGALSRRSEGLLRGFLLSLLGGPLWVFVATHLDAQKP